MILQNRTSAFRKIQVGEEVKVVRPWRDIEVPDKTVYDKKIFKNISVKTKRKGDDK